MGCNNLCIRYEADKINRSLDERPNVRRCAECEVLIPKEFWEYTKGGRVRCPCCHYQLRINSRGKKARQKRQDEYAKTQ